MRCPMCIFGLLALGVVGWITAPHVLSQDGSHGDHGSHDSHGEHHAQDPGDFAFQEPSPEEMEKMMEAWMATTQPGKMHKLLEQQVGKWDITTRLWMGGPAAPPTETKGSATITSFLGGRYIKEEANNEMMGMPYEGMGLVGYDNFKKRFTMMWVDGMSTAMYTAQGTLDMTGTVLTFYGQMDEPMTGEHDKPIKFVVRMKDDNTRVFEIHDLGIVPGETKVVEMVYKRAD